MLFRNNKTTLISDCDCIGERGVVIKLYEDVRVIMH